MRDPYWHICTDCGSDRLVTTHEGDFVCTQCGLVKEERCIDDTVHSFGEVWWEQLYEENTNTSIIDKLGLAHMDDTIKTKILQIHTKASNEGSIKRKTHDNSFWAACVYLASCELKRGMSPTECMMLLGDASSQDFSRKFWDSYKEFGGSASQDIAPVHNNGLARIIHTLDLPNDKVWEVKKIANRLWEQVRDDVGTLKGSKLNGSIVCIACKIAGVVPDLQKLNISKGTLKKHEERIQSILKSRA